MNRNLGGMLLTAIVVAVFALPSTRPYQGQQTIAALSGSAQPDAVPRGKSRVLPQKEGLCASCIPKSPEADLKDTVQEFIGHDIASIQEKVVPPVGQMVDVLIVTVPDPVETHLSLFFDRTIDALQQALTREGYLFAGATLPWDSKPHRESDDWQTRQSQLDFEHLREEIPGLLIYRRPPQENAKNANPLFVLVVGETPTTGVHKDQFARALALSKAWSPELNGVRILGPTFSGSLYSIIEILNLDSHLRQVDLYLHSGTITGGRTATFFQQWRIRNHFDRVHFVSFQENDDYALGQFLGYVRTRGYLDGAKPLNSVHETCYCRPKPQERCSVRSSCLKPENGNLPRITGVVVLTEDETAYGLRPEESSDTRQGRHPGATSDDASCDDTPEDSLVTTLSFPRDISQLRSAYQEDLLKSEAAAADRKTHASLPLNLEDTGGDKDTIVSYAHRQTPLSQEAVLFGIIVNLKKLHPDFVIIRATNPLDELFLVRFLRKAYPKVRIVTIGADLLFQLQGGDDPLEGTLAISPYSLRPDVDRYIPPVVQSQSEHVSILTFPSTFSAGVYNAALSLLECKESNAGDARSICADAPPAPYHEYGWSREWPDDDPARSIARPSLWLLVVGNDGYWPLARLNSDSLRADFTGPGRTLPRTLPTVQPKTSASKIHHLGGVYCRNNDRGIFQRT